MIYDHTQKSGNATVMLADSGRMFTRFNGGYLGLELFHGHNYVEQPDAQDRAGATFIRQGFDHNVITFSLESFSLGRTKEELFKENRMMLNISQLKRSTDSVQKKMRMERHQVLRQTNAYFTFLRFDTLGQAANRKVQNWKVPATRLTATTSSIIQQAVNRANNVRAFTVSNAERLNDYARNSACSELKCTASIRSR
jgi:lipopolysaccharide export system permease protein